jgi:hypothetical protein
VDRTLRLYETTRPRRQLERRVCCTRKIITSCRQSYQLRLWLRETFCWPVLLQVLFP